MRTAFFLLLAFCPAAGAFAQCPEFTLVDLQSIQRATVAEKENLILSLGFDLYARTANSLRYNKCWNSHRNGKEIYDQVIFWNTGSGNIVFMTPYEEAFLVLRKSIEGRHGHTGTLGASDIYIGKIFMYKFGSKWLDGVMHWTVEISFK